MHKHISQMGDTMTTELELVTYLYEHCAVCDATATTICDWCGGLSCDEHVPDHTCTSLELSELENDLTERCDYCGNVADDYCERCAASVCAMHTVYDICPACAIVGFITRFDKCIHAMYGNVNASNAQT